MKLRMTSVLVCAGLFLSGCATHPTNEASNSYEALCKQTDEAEIAALFDRWNAALQTGEPEQVVALYAEDSILLPTLSNQPRLTQEEREAYFVHFLEDRPVGTIDLSHIEVGCNTALDAGLYTFRFAATGAEASGRYSYTYRWDGDEWVITSHHSSLLPE